MGILPLLDALVKPRNILLSVAIITSVVAVVIANFQNVPQDSIEQLPFCGDESERTVGRRLLYITTLDGKLTALDVSKDGQERWSLTTGPGSLISSSIHRLELTNNGQLVRMIPSLNGGIYKFDGHTIDPIPITADNLLSASFKFSDDLVISGGKETRSYGVSVRTGQTLYECNMHGCHNYTDTFSVDSRDISNEHDPLLDDVVIVRRQTQTVRAVEPRTGSERWNFSVGHHELEILRSPECHDRPRSDFEMAMLDLEIKVIVPEGIICGFSKSNPGVMLWKRQFSSPIVSAWQIDRNNVLKSVDIFDSAQWVWTPKEENLAEKLVPPSIYLGMFQKQLYIQESSQMRKLVMDKTHEFNYHIISSESSFPSIPWKPVPATSSGLALIAEDITSGAASNSLIPHENNPTPHQDEENTSVTALSVLYASEYVNGNGFYLYSSADLNKTQRALCDSNASISENIIENDLDFDFIGSEPPVQIMILSLWYWWKEILVISLTSALVLNLLLSPKIRREREVVVIERHIPVPTGVEATEENISKSNSSGRSLSESASINSDNFISRFQSDFDLIQCLGKGGFGVVFEATNKLDGCNYAIKRISLPNKKDSRDRVMREVKTLANCEHQNIVRYFQAWVETPPPGWQEIEDEKWLQRDVLSTSIDIETPDGTTLPKFPKDSISTINSLLSNNNKILNSWTQMKTSDQSKQLDSWFSEIKNNYDSEEDSCSFIQFKEDSKAAGDSIAIDMMSKKGAFVPNIDLFSDKSDSLQIEFKHSTNDQNLSEMSEFSKTSTPRRTHKRPLSLDLTSRGNVIVPVQPRIQNKVYLYIQMQLCRKQSLRDWLRENKADTRQPHIKGIFEQIVDAVDYVHLKGLIHRDLKPSNIFFSLDGQIKIGDFGLVTDTSDVPSIVTTCEDKTGLLQRAKHTQQVGTHLYMSPEQLQGKPYDFKVDIYSLGLIFFELLRYFDTEMERIVTLKGLRDGKFPDDFKEFFQDEFSLLRLMLSTIPHERPATFQIKEKLYVINPWSKSSALSEQVNTTCRLEYNSHSKALDEMNAS